MKLHNTATLEQRLLGQAGVREKSSDLSRDTAQHYALKLANMLSDTASVALSKHGDFGTIDAEVEILESKLGSTTFGIILNDATVMRPSISYKDHDPVNMLDEFNYGWNAAIAFRARDRHGHRIVTRRRYYGEHFIEDTIRDFNSSAPDGVYAYATNRMDENGNPRRHSDIEFGDAVSRQLDNEDNFSRSNFL